MRLLQRINTITWKVIFFYAVTMIFLFSLVYYFVSIWYPGHGLSVPDIDLLTAFYFSIVTFSSLGYGDIVPVGFSRLIGNAISESRRLPSRGCQVLGHSRVCRADSGRVAQGFTEFLVPLQAASRLPVE